MRFALIVALVGSMWLLHVDTVEARSGGSTVQAQRAKKQKAKKRHSSEAKVKAKATHKRSKRSRKAPVEAEEDVAVADDTDKPAPVPEVVAPSRHAVAQATDDEEPTRPPIKRR